MQKKKLKFLATIKDESLPENTDPDLEINYIDISNVDSNGTIDTIVKYALHKHQVEQGELLTKAT